MTHVCRGLLSCDRAHGLDGFAFELTELAHHIIEEMRTRLTACKTVMKGGLELPQFAHEAFHITGTRSNVGMVNPSHWSGRLVTYVAPEDTRDMQEEHTE